MKALFACLLLGSALALSGCTSSSSASLEEEKEPHFLEGKSRANMMDYAGALESFEQALEVNPKSAAAHFELGCLCDQKEADPAAAIYHYGRYLKLRPRGEKAERARDRIASCRQQLAVMVSTGPITAGVQRDQDALLEQIKRLTEDNKLLREKLERAESATGPVRLAFQSPSERVERLDKASFVSPPAASAAKASLAGETSRRTSGGAASQPASAGRTHTVASGETPSAIARRYGVKLATLMAANPHLDPHRMRIGQTVTIPSTKS